MWTAWHWAIAVCALLGLNDILLVFWTGNLLTMAGLIPLAMVSAIAFGEIQYRDQHSRNEHSYRRMVEQANAEEARKLTERRTLYTL